MGQIGLNILLSPKLRLYKGRRDEDSSLKGADIGQCSRIFGNNQLKPAIRMPDSSYPAVSGLLGALNMDFQSLVEKYCSN